ncbi:hypothetical protein RB195_021048 [Necator americanus]|uniref:EndoU domain-containing protein n=1 Tax=Necator americanus TaxID=51031 RepID=A0ABR1EBQ9_NECAM
MSRAICSNTQPLPPACDSSEWVFDEVKKKTTEAVVSNSVLAGDSQSKITDILNHLVQIDSRLDEDTSINYQNMASHKDFSHDNAPKPLYTFVAQSALSGPTYEALDTLLTFYNNPDSDTAEIMTPAWNTSINAFLDSVVKTPVMQSAQSFLEEMGHPHCWPAGEIATMAVMVYLKTMTSDHLYFCYTQASQKSQTFNGLASTDTSAFKDCLYSLWFTLYARNVTAGSSGFEALFAGEVQQGSVIRFANWIRFYHQESDGNLNYHGWFQRAIEVELSVQFAWNSWKAMEFSMLLNTSPEFELAAYTICALTDGQNLVNKMRAADIDKAASTDYRLDWGNKETGTSDDSKNDLFAYVNETIYQRPVYAHLIAVVEGNLFVPDVCKAEDPMSGFRKSQIQLMFDTWTSTEVFNLAFQFLQENGEWNGGTVDGQHSWVTYYNLQKASKINYHGYYTYVTVSFCNIILDTSDLPH